LEKPATPVYNAVSCGQSTFKLGNVFFIQGNFNPPENAKAGSPGEIDSAREILKQLEDEVESLLTTQPITEEEFRRAVKKLKVTFAETSETAAGIAEAIGEAVTVSGSLDSYLGYLDVLTHLTLDQVNATARQYLTLNKAYTSVMIADPNSKKEEPA